jgi:hypothetical protein
MMKADAGPEFKELVSRIDPQFIKNPPQGKHGKYVGHSDIGQITLAKLGRPHDWNIVEVVRGHIPAGKTSSGKEYPERPQGIVAVLGRLEVEIDGEKYRITEGGEANSPQTSWDWENLKTAASDAYKRAWMRVGVGLELWVEQGADPSRYWLNVIFNPSDEEDE